MRTVAAAVAVTLFIVLGGCYGNGYRPLPAWRSITLSPRESARVYEISPADVQAAMAAEDAALREMGIVFDAANRQQIAALNEVTFKTLRVPIDPRRAAVVATIAGKPAPWIDPYSGGLANFAANKGADYALLCRTTQREYRLVRVPERTITVDSDSTAVATASEARGQWATAWGFGSETGTINVFRNEVVGVDEPFWMIFLVRECPQEEWPYPDGEPQ